MSLVPVGVLYADQRDALESDRYISTRSAGMGGVGLCHVTDWNAAFLNPALIGNPLQPGTGRSQRALKSLSFPSLSAESTENSAKFINSLSNSRSQNAQDSKQSLLPILESFDGSNGIHFRQQLFPNLVVNRFLFGVYQSNLVDLQSYKLSRPKVSEYSKDGTPATYSKAAQIFLRSEIFGVLGFSVPMGSRASLGVMTRYGARTTYAGDAELGAGTEAESSEKIFDKSRAVQGFSADAGVTFVVAPSAGLAVSAVGRNLGKGQYEPLDAGSDENKSVAEMDALDLDAGVSLAPRFRKAWFSPSLSAEYLGALREDLKPKDRVKFGAELGLANLYKDSILALRAGYDLAAPSFGASIDLFLFKLEFAQYNHVVRLPENQKRNETRYLVRTSWDLQN